MAGFPRVADEYDIIVAGGGHAGLQAGLKAALLNFRALVLDKGPKYGRSYYAPKMENIPGFPDGISGHKLLDLQAAQLRARSDRVTYVTPAKVVAAHRAGGKFHVEYDWLRQRRTVRSRALVLAMGIVDRMPDLDGKIDAIFPWANLGLVYFCEFCDGHDLTDRSVAVLGHERYAAHLAQDLRHFQPRSVEIVTLGRPFLADVPPDVRAPLVRALDGEGTARVETPVVGWDGLRERVLTVRFADGSERTYDRGFSGLGWWTQNTEIPVSLGCRRDAEGYVDVDEDMRALSASDGTPLEGLYVVGDLNRGWNQIPEAWASAERAVIHAYTAFL